MAFLVAREDEKEEDASNSLKSEDASFLCSLSSPCKRNRAAKMGDSTQKMPALVILTHDEPEVDFRGLLTCARRPRSVRLQTTHTHTHTHNLLLQPPK